MPDTSKTGQYYMMIASLTSNMRWANTLNLLKKVIEYYYCRILKWDTFNNSFCTIIKNMPQMQYELVRKFFRAHSHNDMHEIYHQVSDKG